MMKYLMAADMGYVISVLNQCVIEGVVGVTVHFLFSQCLS